MTRLNQPRLSALLLISVSLASCGGSEDVSPTFEDRIPPGLKLESSARVIDWKDEVRLTGRLTQGDGALADETVTLEADVYPFNGQFNPVESVATGDDGTFEFEDAPDANTAYRVTAGDLGETHSNQSRVFVEPNIKVVGAGDSIARYKVTFHHPENHSIQGSSLYTYADIGDGRGLRFFRVIPIKERGLGLSEASVALPFPAGGGKFTYCVGYTPDSGLGAPGDQCTQSKAPPGTDVFG